MQENLYVRAVWALRMYNISHVNSRDAPNRGNRIYKPPGAGNSLACPQVERPVRVEWEKGFRLGWVFCCKQQKTFFMGTGAIKICIIPWRGCCQLQGRFSCSAKSIRTCSPHQLPSSVCGCVYHHGAKHHILTHQHWKSGKRVLEASPPHV